MEKLFLIDQKIQSLQYGPRVHRAEVDFSPLQRHQSLIICKKMETSTSSRFPFASSRQRGNKESRLGFTCQPAPARHRCLTDPAGRTAPSIFLSGNKDKMVEFAEHRSSKKIRSLQTWLYSRGPPQRLLICS